METPSIIYKKLTLENKSLVVRFINGQLNTIPKDFFFPPSLTIIEKCLNSVSGISYGAFDRDEIVGIRLTYMPGLDTENHGYDLGYSDNELMEVAQFHGTLVINEKRYKGIGNRLVKINCEEIFKTSSLKILATVHPDNLNSIRMLINNGFSKKLIANKYNNLPRIIFGKSKIY